MPRSGPNRSTDILGRDRYAGHVRFNYHAMRRLRVGFVKDDGNIGLTQTELAARLGMHRKRVSYYERGRYPWVLPPTASKFAKALAPNPDKIKGVYTQLTGQEPEEKEAVPA